MAAVIDGGSNAVRGMRGLAANRRLMWQREIGGRCLEDNGLGTKRHDSMRATTENKHVQICGWGPPYRDPRAAHYCHTSGSSEDFRHGAGPVTLLLPSIRLQRSELTRPLFLRTAGRQEIADDGGVEGGTKNLDRAGPSLCGRVYCTGR